MSERAGLSDKSVATSASTTGNDNLSTYVNQPIQKDKSKDKSQDKTPGLTTLDTEVAIGGGALLLGGGYVAYEGLGDLKSLNSGINGQLSGLNSQIGKGLGTLQGDITGLEAQLPTLQLGLQSGLTSLGGIQQELGALNTNLTTLESKGLTSPTALSLESTTKGSASNLGTAAIAHVHATPGGSASFSSEHLSLASHTEPLKLMPHADFRTALEHGPGLGTMSAFHGFGLGSVQLKEHTGGGMFHAKAGAPEIHAPEIHAPGMHAPGMHAPGMHAPGMHAPGIHIAAQVHAPMVRAAHVKVK